MTQSQRLKTIFAGVDDNFCGEVVIDGGGKVGRIFIHRGRIAWVVAPSVKRSLLRRLTDKTDVAANELRAVLERCMKTKQNFAEAVVRERLLTREVIHAELLEHVFLSLCEILSWTRFDVGYVRMERTYSGTMTFSPEEILRAAAEPSPAVAAPPAAVVEPSPDSASVPDEPIAFGHGSGSYRTPFIGAPPELEAAREVLARFAEEQSGGLSSCVLVRRADASTVAGFAADPGAAALVASLSEFLPEAFDGEVLPGFGRYAMIGLSGDRVLVVVVLDATYALGLVCDPATLPLGMVMGCLVRPVLAALA